MSPKKSGRPWGMGGVYQVRGRWYVHYPGPSGKGQVKESAGAGATREKADALLDRRLREVANDREGLQRFAGRKGERTLVKDLLKLVEADYATRKLASWRAVGYHAQRVREHLANVRASRLSDQQVRLYIATRRAVPVKDATIDRELEVLRRGYHLGKEAGLVAWIPSFPRLVKTHTNARQGFVDPADADKLIAALEEPDYRDFVQWLYLTGMRPGEASSFTWAVLDRVSGSLRLEARHAKVRRARVIPLVGSLAEIIRRRESARQLPCPLIFHRDGEALVYPGGKRHGFTKRFYLAWARATKKVGLVGVIPYDLRRSAIRNMIAAGVPDQTVMALSGHLTRGMLDRYAIVDERDMRAALEASDAFLSIARVSGKFPRR